MHERKGERTRRGEWAASFTQYGCCIVEKGEEELWLLISAWMHAME
jgi:hypothetical protein